MKKGRKDALGAVFIRAIGSARSTTAPISVQVRGYQTVSHGGGVRMIETSVSVIVLRKATRRDVVTTGPLVSKDSKRIANVVIVSCHWLSLSFSLVT
jgi:hypothetical protein